MPTDPTTRDVETARALSPCWYATPDDPGATCNGVGAPDCCAECQIAERIARALATARAEGEATGRAEEREACAQIADARVRPLHGTASTYSVGGVVRRGVNAAAKDIAAAIRAARSAS